jgi:large subunit ribosomal protein L9
MKVMLTVDVQRVGHKGDILEFSDAYAQNVIINKKVGVRATEQMIKNAAQKIKQKEIAKEYAKDKSREVLDKVSTEKIIIKKKIDEKGNLYAKLSTKDITDYIFALHKVDLDPRQLSIPEVTTLGEYEGEIKNKDRKYKLKISVVL